MAEPSLGTHPASLARFSMPDGRPTHIAKSGAHESLDHLCPAQNLMTGSLFGNLSCRFTNASSLCRLESSWQTSGRPTHMSDTKYNLLMSLLTGHT